MKLDRNAPSFERLRSRLAYDPDTGIFTALKSGGRRKAGDRAGYADTLGYWKVFVDGRWILAHRLAWAWMNGDQWPDGEIDHINGDPSDNRIANLRIANRSQNVANAKFNSLNTTGFRGVCEVRRYRKISYQAEIRKDGKRIFLGRFPTPELAHAAYLEAAIRLHGKFFASDGAQVFVEAPKPAFQEALL